MIKFINVAIIDDGINKHMIDAHVVNSICVTHDLAIKSCTIDDKKLTHGTICASIIESYFNHALFSSVKVLSDTMRGSIHQLATALTWCVDHHIQVVNISLGSHYSKDKLALKQVINQVSESGLIVVCASHNSDLLTFPASFSNVIGVKKDPNNRLDEHHYLFSESMIDGIEFIAFAKHPLHKNNIKTCSHSNSFAAPYITAKVCELMYDQGIQNADAIKHEMVMKAKNYHSDLFIPYPRPDWVNKAVICHINHKIDINHQSLTFESIHEMVVEEKIMVKELETFLSTNQKAFDTMIVIHMGKGTMQEYVMGSILSKYHKHVVFLSMNTSGHQVNMNPINPIKIWHPTYKLNGLLNMCESICHIKEPIISICIPQNIGLEFFVQLHERFNKDGYNPFSCTTNVLGVLYDMDYIPHVSADKVLQYISYILNRSHYDMVMMCQSSAEKTMLESDVEIVLSNEKGCVVVEYKRDGMLHRKKKLLPVHITEEVYHTIIEIFN